MLHKTSCEIYITGDVNALPGIKREMHAYRAEIIEKLLVVPPLLPLVAKPNHCMKGEEALALGEKSLFRSALGELGISVNQGRVG